MLVKVINYYDEKFFFSPDYAGIHYYPMSSIRATELRESHYFI